MTGNESVGVILGSQDASPLEFWVGVEEGAILQLDDVVAVDTELPDGRLITLFGVIDHVRKRYEGAQFDLDAFHAADGLLPVQISYAAHVQVTRLDPEVFVPPTPGEAVRKVSGTDFERALCADRMDRRLPIGVTRAGQVVYANVDFFDGTRGAHASISGISGVATKTSYATFLLYSLFHSGALGLDATNAAALIFNVKGEDLLWLDKENARIDAEARGEYQRLGLPAGAFRNVGLYAPTRRGTASFIADVGSRHQGVQPFAWTIREFARERMLHFAFVEADDAQSQLAILIEAVERYLARAASHGDPEDPGINLEGKVRIESFDALVDHFAELDECEHIARRTAAGTWAAFQRRLRGAGAHLGHLVRGENEARNRSIEWRTHQVTVVDIHALHQTAQMFVVGVVLKRLMHDKEQQATGRPLVYVLLDELNKYAPRDGWSPIQDVLLDIAERGRSLGVCLLGAQQTASEVERRIVANAALKVVGRLDAAEAERAEYGFLTPASRRRATMLSPGTMVVVQPEVPTPLLLHFPFPSWATRQSEVSVQAGDEDPFARF
jgi:hypothetical protein